MFALVGRLSVGRNVFKQLCQWARNACRGDPHEPGLGDGPRPSWIVWARLFSALEQIWLFLNRGDLAGESPDVQASFLRRMLKGSVVSQFDRCGLALVFGDESAHLGETLIPFFVERTRAVLESVERLGS